MASQPTKSGTRRLSEVARHVVKPSGITSTGWPAVRDKCRDLGVEFDEWQDGAGRLILAKRADGKLAAMVGGIGMSLPRQIGKTYLIAALIFALAILRPGLLIIWTAHHLRTSSETFLAMQGFARRRRVQPYIEAVYKGSGDEAIIFRNGSRILFGARERGFGRGIPGVDVLMCDEAQILTDRALDNMLATLNISDLGLVLYVGTPPRPEDPSEAFSRMREEALSGKSTDLVWIECGADPGASLDDRKQWAKANPSFPHRTPAESILRLQKKLSPDSFMREALGIWDSAVSRKLDPNMWAIGADSNSKRGDLLAFAADSTPDGTFTVIAVASLRKDGKTHVEIVDQRRNVHWAVQRLVNLQKWAPVATVIDPASPARALIALLEAEGIEVMKPSARDAGSACGQLAEAVKEGKIRHLDDRRLNDAIAGASPKDLGEGLWRWTRTSSTVDISPLVAVTNAAWGLAVKANEDYDVLESIY